MGMFDEYGKNKIQIHAQYIVNDGPRWYKTYQLGDKVLIKDGLYVSFNGAIVIENGIFFRDFGKYFDHDGFFMTEEKYFRIFD